MSETAKKVLKDLESKGYYVRLNQDESNVQLKTCLFCGNDHWNLDIELENKFLYGCWACGAGGTSRALLLRLKCSVIVAAPEGRSDVTFSPKTQLYFQYQVNYSRHTAFLANKLDIKFIHKDRPVTFSALTISSGIMLLGHLGHGVLLADDATLASRCTAGDLYLYNYSSKDTTLAVVEGFYDIFPFFKNTMTLVLTGTSIRKTILNETRAFFQRLTKIYVALDQKAEKAFLRQLKELQVTAEVIILYPDKHSPAESNQLIASCLA